MMDEKLIGKKQGNKSNWRLVLGSIALFPGMFAGTVGILQSPAQAASAIKPAITLESTRENFNESLQIAQVGISSPSNAPIPLNLRPRFHIPLPTDSRSRDDDYHSEYEHGYDDGYDHGYDDGYHRGKHRDYAPRTSKADRHKKDTVIIINPATSSTYENYDNYDRDNYNRDNHQRRYIRIIRNQVSF
ncbi:MAG: hypothetical protein RLZZ04_436 [Cyanobacteriota bacterium]|jgi:hypothetical protein